MTIFPAPKSVCWALALFTAFTSARAGNDQLLNQNRLVAKTEILKPEKTAEILFENADETLQLWTLHDQRALCEAAALRALATGR